MNLSSWKSIVFFVTLLLVGEVASATPLEPWIDPVQPAFTHYWQYDFNDNVNPPTVTLEDGNWDPGTDPDFAPGGLTVQTGRLGLFGPGQDTAVTLRITLPNIHSDEYDKWFFFRFDWNRSFPTANFVTVEGAGTADGGSTPVGDIVFTDAPAGTIAGYQRFHPQPSSEYIDIRFAASAGQSVWIDNLRLGSVCIPEPAGVALLTAGFALCMPGRPVRRS